MSLDETDIAEPETPAPAPVTGEVAATVAAWLDHLVLERGHAELTREGYPTFLAPDRVVRLAFR